MSDEPNKGPTDTDRPVYREFRLSIMGKIKLTSFNTFLEVILERSFKCKSACDEKQVGIK